MMRKQADSELHSLCDAVRNYTNMYDYTKCISLISNAMSKYPHAPEPHNLYGIVLEKEGDHTRAMKHFRAARALDPTYLPALHNLEHYGTFFSEGGCAFDEEDCQDEDKRNWVNKHEKSGINHLFGR